VQKRNNSPTLLAFAPVFGVTSTGTYPENAPDMHRRMYLEDEPNSGAIRGNYFFPAPLAKNQEKMNDRIIR
jgi:hypothetical protein